MELGRCIGAVAAERVSGIIPVLLPVTEIDVIAD
jgi:hypothetical protein